MAKTMLKSCSIVLAVSILAGSTLAQEYGQRIGRRSKQNFILKAVEEEEPVAPLRTGRIDTDAGYSYLPPANPLLLPSSSNQVDHQVTMTAIKSQANDVFQQELEAIGIEVQEIDPQQSWPLITADQNLAPVVQQPLDDEIAFWDFRESIPGDPEFDYPILDRIPPTSFRCNGQRDGYYADVETRCQVFHVCASVPDAEPIKASFLCPNGTIFNQQVFVCQWWPDVNCAESAQFFELNRHIGVVPEKHDDAHSPTTRHERKTTLY